MTADTKNIYSPLGLEILKRRCLQKDQQRKVMETPDEMFDRVARSVAKVEAQCGASDEQIDSYRMEFLTIMKKSLFLPSSPTLMNAGPENGMLSACFVLPIPDSIDGIFDAVKNTALIQKSGGGTGFSFDRLRPTGDIVASSGGTTSGPISFWKVISETTHAIQQGAFRRGANMGMISIAHPDIIKFIHAKQNISICTNFNISVKIDDLFMAKLENEPESPHIVINPRTQNQYLVPKSIDLNSYTINDLIPVGATCAECFTTRNIWDMIVRNAHATGEPGICFIGRINESNPTPHVGAINATNPCGEQPLLDYESCNLGSINISKFIRPEFGDMEWKDLANIIKYAVRFLDNVIDANYWPIPEVKKVSLANRKIGLGIMGFADSLVQLGIRYDSDEAVSFGRKVAKKIQEFAHQESEDLAKERGCFPSWDGSIWQKEHRRPMRHAAVTTIAPTGTISIIANCNAGIEPIFSFVSVRRALDGQKFVQLHPVIEKLGTKEDWLNDNVRDQLAKGISPKNISEIPSKISSALVTAHEIAPEWHVNIQAAFQEYTDNAVSKTVNLRSDATVDDVETIYHLAYELGCKGITVYRDGSRDNQVITAAHKVISTQLNTASPRPRPQKTTGNTIKAKTGCGSLFITINNDEQGLFEIFTNLGKAGGCPSQSEATARVLSVAIRSGVEPKVLMEQLKGIRCLSTIARRKENKNIQVLSCPDAIAGAFEDALGEDCEVIAFSNVNKCPDCSYRLRREEGCNVCDNCGFSKCG